MPDRVDSALEAAPKLVRLNFSTNRPADDKNILQKVAKRMRFEVQNHGTGREVSRRLLYPVVRNGADVAKPLREYQIGA